MQDRNWCTFPVHIKYLHIPCLYSHIYVAYLRRSVNVSLLVIQTKHGWDICYNLLMKQIACRFNFIILSNCIAEIDSLIKWWEMEKWSCGQWSPDFKTRLFLAGWPQVLQVATSWGNGTVMARQSVAEGQEGKQGGGEFVTVEETEEQLGLCHCPHMRTHSHSWLYLCFSYSICLRQSILTRLERRGKSRRTLLWKTLVYGWDCAKY